jgi:hypothetical protein
VHTSAAISPLLTAEDLSALTKAFGFDLTSDFIEFAVQQQHKHDNKQLDDSLSNTGGRF